MSYVELLPEIVKNFARRSMPVIDEHIVMQRIACKIERAAERMDCCVAPGVQVVARCSGIVCCENGKYYVETGIVGVVLPKFGENHLAARLAGVWVN